jgi:hypothetical protein
VSIVTSSPFFGNLEPSGRHLQKDCSLAVGLGAFRPAEAPVCVFVEFFGHDTSIALKKASLAACLRRIRFCDS